MKFSVSYFLARTRELFCFQLSWEVAPLKIAIFFRKHYSYSSLSYQIYMKPYVMYE